MDFAYNWRVRQQSPLQDCQPFFSRYRRDDDSKRYYENFITFVKLIEISQPKSGDGTGLPFFGDCKEIYTAQEDIPPCPLFNTRSFCPRD